MLQVKNMTKEKNWFDQFSSFMDQNIRGVQYGVYSLAGLGLIIALRSVRPFAKFSLPTDIPKHFIEKRMSFIGKVNIVEPSRLMGANPILLVHHKPLIALSNKYVNDGLPVEISSVNITSNGLMWMQSLLTNKDIKFIPLKTATDRVFSIVYSKDQNIGQHLVSIGFAIVTPIDVTLEKDQYYLKYYKGLISAEKKAERKRAGVWADGKVSFSRNLLNKLKNAIPFSM